MSPSTAALAHASQSNSSMVNSSSSKSAKPPIHELDRIDRQLLRLLQHDGRQAVSELARAVHLTTTPCYERVKRLERDGYIQGYTALICPERLGLPLVAFVEVTIDRTSPEVFQSFQSTVESFDEVVECSMVAGNFDYLLKIRVADIAAYRRFLGVRLATTPGLTQTRTYMVMEQVKCTRRLPV